MELKFTKSYIINTFQVEIGSATFDYITKKFPYCNGIFQVSAFREGLSNFGIAMKRWTPEQRCIKWL